ncbi:MAG TPA: SIS domain-containing protein, partial [Gaiellaceae bacterium]|nr:SIS domain-containing protein [Gaiellaceae bacterium]
FIYTDAGPEISIASTKAFTAQMACLFLLALHLGEINQKLSRESSRLYISELLALPVKTETVLSSSGQIEQLAELYYRLDDFMFLGRAIHYPIAMDGALKLKEVSYIHAEGYPTGEAKHGPNALIDYRLPLVIIATRDLRDPASVLRYEKTVGNMEGFKKQGGTIIAIATAGRRVRDGGPLECQVRVVDRNDREAAGREQRPGLRRLVLRLRTVGRRRERGHGREHREDDEDT